MSNLGKVIKLSAASDYSESTTIYTAESNTPQTVHGIAVDPRTHHLFIAHNSDGEFDEYDSEGNLVETVDTGFAGDQFSGIAVDPADHRVYLADETSGKVEVFSPGATVPALGLEAPDPLEDNSATLHGTVDPEGLTLDTCRFEWVSEAAFQESGFEDLASGGEAACDPEAGSIPTSGDTAVSAAIGGLQPGAAYRYRIAAAAGAASGSLTDAFTTPGPAVVETTGAALPGPSSATLGGRLDPRGAASRIPLRIRPRRALRPEPLRIDSLDAALRRRGAAVQRNRLAAPSPSPSPAIRPRRCPTTPRAPRCRRRWRGWGRSAPGNVRVAGGEHHRHQLLHDRLRRQIRRPRRALDHQGRARRTDPHGDPGRQRGQRSALRRCAHRRPSSPRPPTTSGSSPTTGTAGRPAAPR